MIERIIYWGGKGPYKRTQHCWMLNVAWVCTPCCVLLEVVASVYALLQTRTQQIPTSLDQQCWKLHIAKDLRTTAAAAAKTSLKKRIHFLSIFIVISPSHLLCQMQANSPGVEFLRTTTMFRRKEKQNFVVPCLRSPQNVKLDIFTS